MSVQWDYREHVYLGAALLTWLAICLPLSLVVGSAVALFLWSLDRVTELQWHYPWLLYGLPLAGLGSGWVYQRWGGDCESGNNLIMEQIHEPGGGVPSRLAPLVLVGTLVTHLFGGSAGREGTAVQMGGSLASRLGRVFRLGKDDTRIMLMAGVAAGFGAVFGTPLTGAIFAVEVLAIGRLTYHAFIPCLLASIGADQVCQAWGIGHAHYPISVPQELVMGNGTTRFLAAGMLAKVAVAAVAFGLVSVLFAELTSGLQRFFRTAVVIPWLRPALGGGLIIALVWLLGERDYLGLGVAANPRDPTAVTIASSFQPGGAAWLSWWWKLLFTAITVSSGFKGGEVTPLFFIGATLGHTLGRLLGVPVDFLAGLGFVAVFAGATNTPLACTVMAIELFAPHSPELLSSGFVVYAALACFLSYFLSGHSSIYHAQRIAVPKTIHSRRFQESQHELDE